jgi:membrane protease subunit HflC
MPRNLPLILGVAFALLVVVLNSMFIVRQDRQAFVVNFGEFSRAINDPGSDEPGLYFKIPFVEIVVIYD